jgi:hypothetical protein
MTARIRSLTYAPYAKENANDKKDETSEFRWLSAHPQPRQTGFSA